eukprot:TRINITY_DN17695_c0_g1_i1.p1 TRINITY_DN17695_c0_g1~~TRINITY_DN17695_c0_g1_i1.p1  ORF type:complete len:490 (+),score=65.29 TRINITY_DN17695_c0_g1_i1:111-1472(+)
MTLVGGMAYASVQRCRGSNASARTLMREAMAPVRAPGILVVPYLFLLPGTGLSCALLLAAPADTVDSAAHYIAGVFALLFCLASPYVLYLCIPSPRNATRSAACTPDRALVGMVGWRRRAYLLVFGDTVWVSSDAHRAFVERYGMVFDALRPAFRHFILGEIAYVLVISALSAWRPALGTPCNIRNGLLCLASGVLLAMHVLGPYISPVENVLAASIAAATFAAVLTMTLSIASEEPDSRWAFIAQCSLEFAGYAAITKAAWDLMRWVHEVLSSGVCSQTRDLAEESDDMQVVDELFDFDIQNASLGPALAGSSMALPLATGTPCSSSSPLPIDPGMAVSSVSLPRCAFPSGTSSGMLHGGEEGPTPPRRPVRVRPSPRGNALYAASSPSMGHTKRHLHSSFALDGEAKAGRGRQGQPHASRTDSPSPRARLSHREWNRAPSLQDGSMSRCLT